MKLRISASIITALLFILASVTGYARSITFPCSGSIIVLLDSSEAAGVSMKPDAYTREQTQFDLAIRFDNISGTTTKDYLQAAARDVRTWPAEEQALLRKSFSSIDSFAKATGIKMHMPDTVKMIKTTAKEEFGAEGYTRENRIMLNTGSQPISLHLVAHELWHVISRYNPRLRDAAYAVFHFKPCNNIVYKPALNDQVITNPDCPYLMHYVTVEKDSRKQDVAVVLYSKKPYHQGYTMNDYANIGLLALTGDDRHKKPLIKDGKAVIYEITETPDFMKQIGTNTQYIIHIEEITADHFAALVAGERYNQLEYIEGLKKALMM